MSASSLLALGAALAAAPLVPLEASGLETPLLALAFVGEDEVVALSPMAVTLHRLDRGRLEMRARHAVATSGPPARRPGGLLRASPDERRVWALASGWSAALLLDPDAGLAVRIEAEALPWREAPRGVRIRPGTNLLEAAVPGLGDGPFLALTPGLAIDGDGRLVRPGAEPASRGVGTPLQALDDARVLAGSAAAPGEPDALLLVEADAVRTLRADLPGAIRALAAVPQGDGAWRCVLGLERETDGDVETRLYAVALTGSELGEPAGDRP